MIWALLSKEHQETRVWVACLAPPVTKDLQDSQEHRVYRELAVLAQVVAEPRVFQEPKAQRERKVTPAHRPMAPKVSPAPQDSQDPPALPVLRAPLVLPSASPPVTPGSPERRAPEEHRVTRDSKASEAISATAPAWAEAPQGLRGYLAPREAMAARATPDKRESWVTLVHPALVAFRVLLVVLEKEASTVAREKRASLTTPTWAWA